MKTTLRALLALALAALAVPAFGQTLSQNLPANTLVGRLGAGTSGPAQAIPMSNTTLTSQFGFLQSGTNTVPRSMADKLRDIISVKDWGAKGDSNGTHSNGTDDTVAFQKALDNAPSSDIFVPCGLYRITSKLTANTASQIIRLYGAGTQANFKLSISQYPLPTHRVSEFHNAERHYFWQ
jgi:hypothetical protein